MTNLRKGEGNTCLGCSPRPLKSPGGSMRKFPIFSSCPSMTAMPYSFWMASFFSFSCLRSSLLRPLRSSDTQEQNSFELFLCHDDYELQRGLKFRTFKLRAHLKSKHIDVWIWDGLVQECSDGTIATVMAKFPPIQNGTSTQESRMAAILTHSIFRGMLARESQCLVVVIKSSYMATQGLCT